MGGDPSLAGRFDINSSKATVDAFLGPVLATMCILIVYYAQYTTGLSLACTNICATDPEQKSKRVMFIAGQIVHFFFIFCVIFGVFSRHFENGGF